MATATVSSWQHGMDELFQASSGHEGGEWEVAEGGPMEKEIECSGGEDEWSAQMAGAECDFLALVAILKFAKLFYSVDDWKFAAEQFVRWSDRAQVLADRMPSTAKQLTRYHRLP
uniref:Uncharacterized protein n=1 Tax=Oryza meridionalis TaxID=40149 RepID=A0A0E0F3S2_9ORYZ